MLSRAGLNRLAGPKASLLLILAANAPDSDAVSWAWGSAANLRYHRGITHAWVFVPVMALLPLVITWWFTRKSEGAWSWWKAYLAAIIGVSSHLLLDWTNSYGIRTLLPFSSEWLSLHTTFVVDPYVWGVLTLAVVGPFLSSLVSGEIGGKRASGRGWAIFALVFLGLYTEGRYMAHEHAIATLNTRMYNGESPRRVGAFPQFASPMRWSAVVELPDAYWVSEVDLLREFDPTDGRIFFKATAGPAIEAAKRTDPFQAFVDFNQWPLWRVTPMSSPEGSQKVELFDLRFGNPTAPGFLADALVLPGNQVDKPEFRFGAGRLKRN